MNLKNFQERNVSLFPYLRNLPFLCKEQQNMKEKKMFAHGNDMEKIKHRIFCPPFSSLSLL